MDGIWDPPCYQVTEDTSSFCFPYDVIEETSINEKCCIQVLEILISKANDEIVEHEEELTDLLSQLACTDEVFSAMFAVSLTAKIDYLDSSIRKLEEDAEDFLSTSREPAESIYDILKSLFCRYLQKKDLQVADETGTALSSYSQVPAENKKKQTGSSSNTKQIEKCKNFHIIPVEKETVSLTTVKIEEEDEVTHYPHTCPVPKYNPRSHCCPPTKKTDREMRKYLMKISINSIRSNLSLEAKGKCKQQLSVIKSQTYDESVSLATVPHIESSEQENVLSLATVPYIESSEEANEKQIVIKESDFPPGYPNRQQHQQSTSLSKNLSSTRKYARRKKPDSQLQTSSNPPCLAVIVPNPIDRAEIYSNLYAEDFYTVNDLKAMARERNLKGYSKFRKAELAELLGIKLTEGRRKQPKRRDAVSEKKGGTASSDDTMGAIEINVGIGF